MPGVVMSSAEKMAPPGRGVRCPDMASRGLAQVARAAESARVEFGGP